jgi:3-deoxy-manno-octulosonate cytidylyltransferase (CMP-KDO synthetase)
MKTAIVIPSRGGSTRFPRKPLAVIAGKSMVQRVYEIAKAVQNVDLVAVATDDKEIFDHVESFGGTAIMTPSSCPNGTDRVMTAINTLDEEFDIVLNFQGDTPLTPPWILQAVIDKMQENPDVKLCTPAVRFTPEVFAKFKAAKDNGEVGGTCVTLDQNDNALYFSKSIIPFVRSMPENGEFPVLKHIGLYGYRFDTLKQYLELPETMLENVEGLEQLRPMYYNIPIKVVEVDFKGRTPWAVDSPEDAKMVEEIIAREGEII